MTDIVERLHMRAEIAPDYPLMQEAANEIKRLRAKIKRWEAQSIAQYAEIKRLREPKP